jgi:hypothetical protein
VVLQKLWLNNGLNLLQIWKICKVRWLFNLNKTIAPNVLQLSDEALEYVRSLYLLDAVSTSF